PPDLLIADVMMPRLDGFGLLKALRADESLKQIPVLMLSARAGEESRIEGLAAGADDYLVKPFSARELLTRVGATIALARMRSEIQRRAAADLEAMARVRELGEMCANNGDDLARCLDSILDTAIAVSGADKGNVQLFDRESGALKIEVQRGFDRPFLEFSAIVRSGESAA